MEVYRVGHCSQYAPFGNIGIEDTIFLSSVYFVEVFNFAVCPYHGSSYCGKQEKIS